MGHNLQHEIAQANKLSGVENPSSFEGGGTRSDIRAMRRARINRAIGKSKGKKSALHGRERPTR